MTRTNYQKPSNLLLLLKLTGKSYNFAHADGGPLDNTFPEAIDNQHISEDGGEEPNVYDKFYNSKVGEALQWVPYVGTVLDIGNAINHPSWENAGWAAASLASDLFGGRIATKAAKTAAKKVIAEGVKNGGYVLSRTPRGTILKVPTKVAARNSATTTKIAYKSAFQSDNFAQYLTNARGSYQRPIHLPEVTVTTNYPNELRVWNTVNLARYGFNEPEFLRRLDYNDRRYIKTPYGGESTHLMTNDGKYAYPNILDVNGTLHNYDEKYGDYWNRDYKENGDYIKFLTPGDARYFAEHYKKYWPIFFQGAFKNGKDILPGFKEGYDSLYDPTKNVLDEVVIKPDKYTKQLINLMHTDFPDKNVRDYIYKVADRYTDMSLSTYNDVLARTLAMYDLGGKPSISVTPKYERYRTKRRLIANKSTLNPIAKALGIRYISNYNPLSNHINIIGDSPNDFEQEISHGILRNYLGPFMALRTKKDNLQGFINASIKGGFPYYTPGYTEYNAHHLILPNVFKYITTGNKNYIKYIRSGVYGKEAK